VRRLRAAGTVEVSLPEGSVTLAEDDLLVEAAAPEGWQVEAEGGRLVAVRTVLDDDLRREGLARELVHAVQLARKNAGLRIDDRIVLALGLPDALRPAAEAHLATLAGETLASEVVLDGARGDHVETAKVEGHEVGIGITVAARQGATG